MTDRKEPAEAWAELKQAVAAVFEPPLKRIIEWLDRKLTR